MQKVDGTSPFIRFEKPPETGAFLLLDEATKGWIASASASVLLGAADCVRIATRPSSCVPSDAVIGSTL
jgi:hypothetical protein